MFLLPFTLSFQESFSIFDRGPLFYHMILWFLYAVIYYPRRIRFVLMTKLGVISALFYGLLIFWESIHPYTDKLMLTRTAIMLIASYSIAATLTTKYRINLMLRAIQFTAAIYIVVTIVFGYRFIESGANNINAFIFLNEFFGSTRNPNDIGALIAFLGSVSIIRIIDSERRLLHIYNLLNIALILSCIVSIYLLDSRTAMVIMVVLVTSFFYYFKRQSRVGLIVIGLIIFGIVFNYVAYFEKNFAVYVNKSEDFENIDGRSRIYNAFFETIDETILFGVGNGNMLNDWGYSTGFKKVWNRAGSYKVKVGSAHNYFFQLVIIGGFSLLIMFLLILRNIYERLPSRFSASPTDYYVYMYSLTMFMLLFFSHNIEGKEFSIFLALALASYKWKSKKGN